MLVASIWIGFSAPKNPAESLDHVMTCEDTIITLIIKTGFQFHLRNFIIIDLIRLLGFSFLDVKRPCWGGGSFVRFILSLIQQVIY